MDVQVVSARDLTAGQLARWDALQRAHPDLASPYFRPEFTQAVAAVRDDVQVAVLSDGTRIVGFFPFQRLGPRVAGPVGGRLSDAQGLIVEQGVHPDPLELLRGCGLHIFDFDHLLASQQGFLPHHTLTTSSPVMDLSDGFEAYRQARRAAGSNRLEQMLRKARKLGREIGPLHLETQADEAEILQHVVDWKSEQCRRTGVTDFFGSMPWTVALVERIQRTRGPDFAGMLSVLRAGDRLVAAHFGMRSARVWHWWFPGYDRELGRYSPGSVLLLEMARAAADLGLTCIDLGKGADAYKASFMSGEITLAEGSVLVPSWSAMLRRARVRAETFLRAVRSRARGTGAGRA